MHYYNNDYDCHYADDDDDDDESYAAIMLRLCELRFVLGSD